MYLKHTNLHCSFLSPALCGAFSFPVFHSRTAAFGRLFYCPKEATCLSL
nr:MAG TPA: hypothetical protein [Caudoviricetes sp.]